MAKGKESRACTLTLFEKRLYCGKKKVGPSCLKPWFLGYRCPNLTWTKEDVRREARKGVTQIVSKSGFSKEAVSYAERFRPGLRLKHGDKVVKPMRRKKLVASVA